MDRATKQGAIDGELLNITTHEYHIKKMLNELFPEGTRILVRLRDNCGPSTMTVLCCDGRGYVRAYMDRDNGKRRFVRDVFYTKCRPWGGS